MRTQKFQKVFDRVVRMMGRDALAEAPQDMARAILDHINERVETIHQAWDWPEWTITEERAFRQVWNTTTQYKRASDLDGLPDEVFYLGATFSAGGDFGTGYGYYRVKSDAVTDPPIGTVPTDTDYFEAMDEPIDAYVAYDQGCGRAIGRVIGVYKGNPRQNGCGGGLWFRPSMKGIDVRGNANPTVFLTYLMPKPEYTIVPYVAGKTYVRGDTVFDPATGECFQAVESVSTAPPGTGWVWIPFLDKWATFVVQGAFADCLGEFDQGGNDDIQAKMALASKAEGRANAAFEARIDEFASQGQVLKYNFCRNRCEWFESLAFVGGAVTTLTEACQSDVGWAYALPPSAAQGFFYYPWVNSLKTTTPTLIASVPTINFRTGTIAKIFTAQEYRLDAGPADGVDPGQGDPADYDLATNNKHWVQVL